MLLSPDPLRDTVEPCDLKEHIELQLGIVTNVLMCYRKVGYARFGLTAAAIIEVIMRPKYELSLRVSCGAGSGEHLLRRSQESKEALSWQNGSRRRLYSMFLWCRLVLH